MCGRTTHQLTWRQVHVLLSMRGPRVFQSPAEEIVPSYNVAPTQMAPIVRTAGDAESLEGTIARWGLIPFWAPDTKIGSRLINARSDGVATKPSFRDAFKKRRCLVPVSGFYEWQVVKDQKAKQPWYIHAAHEGGVMCLAGLWERWDKGDEPVESFTIITTDANEFMKPLHHRMPVILEPESFEAWMSPATAAAELQGLLKPAAAGVLDAYRVSTRVNAPRMNDAECIARA